jgi:hypothetical protein
MCAFAAGADAIAITAPRSSRLLQLVADTDLVALRLEVGDEKRVPSSSTGRSSVH